MHRRDDAGDHREEQQCRVTDDELLAKAHRSLSFWSTAVSTAAQYGVPARVGSASAPDGSVILYKPM